MYDYCHCLDCRSNPAAAAAEPLAALSKQHWQQQWVLPDPEGYVGEADVKLQLADLSSEDWKAFGEQVRSLAVQQEKKQGRFEVGIIIGILSLRCVPTKNL